MRVAGGPIDRGSGEQSFLALAWQLPSSEHGGSGMPRLRQQRWPPRLGWRSTPSWWRGPESRFGARGSSRRLSFARELTWIDLADSGLTGGVRDG